MSGQPCSLQRGNFKTFETPEVGFIRADWGKFQLSGCQRRGCSRHEHPLRTGWARGRRKMAEDRRGRLAALLVRRHDFQHLGDRPRGSGAHLSLLHCPNYGANRCSVPQGDFFVAYLVYLSKIRGDLKTNSIISTG